MRALLQRLPNLQAVVPVYAVIAVLLAGWTITAFLWKLSAWLLLLSLGEILTVFAYAMVANFLESLLVLGSLLLLCVILPARVLRDRFSVRGAILAIGLIGASMAFVGMHMQLGIAGGARLFLAPIVVLLSMTVMLGMSSRDQGIRWVQPAVVWVSDRLIVFLFILVPVFLASSLYVVYRNIT